MERRGVPLRAASDGLPTLADSGYEGAGILTPVRQPADGRPLAPDTRTRNALLRASPALNLLDRAAPELRGVARAGQTSLLMITGGLRPGARRTVRLTTSSTARRPAVLPETLGVR